ncbi:bifunctional diaminohydroxyphosphoribosylaminopyrimidine deaminase/5-amino-6-(5-phosphoribosylamino)uracil reductase RibD [Lentisphaerota bacterium WC36G]|nr:bifunctional diaminohydroxyphosphoribosylaminopyrimidine deaminase/5-amino-6-(5-phosphoribosylamino)uracil reductase RibD [Lentisphaerae bacterium WC36]
MSIKDHKYFMQQALNEALKGWGKVSPNPLVGAVVVDENNQIIGRGHHEYATKYHAEINALNSAINNLLNRNLNYHNFDDKNQLLNNKDEKLLKNCTVYVTLEPCSSFGRTAPCTEALKSCNVKKVVIGCEDDNSLHLNKAEKILQAASIKVISNIEEQQCRNVNETFFKWIKTKKPFVILKMAMTLDGKIATKEGQSKWITGAVARQRVQELRKWSDAILVGAETARLDKPSLTIRDVNNNILDHWTQPKRIILSNNQDKKFYENILSANGGEISVASLNNRNDWNLFLTELGAQNITSLLIEGGGSVAAAALNAQIVDKIEFHVAPKILGGKESRPVVSGENPLSLAEAHNLKDIKIIKYGNDIAISGYCDDKKL